MAGSKEKLVIIGSGETAELATATLAETQPIKLQALALKKPTCMVVKRFLVYPLSPLRLSKASLNQRPTRPLSRFLLLSLIALEPPL
jgi:hypothetical protein